MRVHGDLTIDEPTSFLLKRQWVAGLEQPTGSKASSKLGALTGVPAIPAGGIALVPGNRSLHEHRPGAGQDDRKRRRNYRQPLLAGRI